MSGTMSKLFTERWERLKDGYMKGLINNVEFVTMAESCMKTMSYLVAGRISKTHSAVVAELMYASSNLLSLFNDHLLRKHHNLYQVADGGANSLKMMLSSLEAIEVFIEIAARRYGDSSLKWILIFCVELLKTVGRFLLLHKYKTGLRYIPLIKKLNRKTMKSDSAEEGEDNSPPAAESDGYYTLEHSGRRIKSISSKYRSSVDSASAAAPSTPAPAISALSYEQTVAESLHNLQPLVYLCSAGYFGEKSWMPWLASLATDITSLSILRQEKHDFHYSKSEKSELLRRRFVLLMYLLRSPCYDRYTKMRLLRMLSLLEKVPVIGYVMSAAIAYLPEWQSTYFYTWNS